MSIIQKASPVHLELLFWENKLTNQLVNVPNWVLTHQDIRFEPESGCVYVHRTLVKPSDYILMAPTGSLLVIDRVAFARFFSRYNQEVSD